MSILKLLNELEVSFDFLFSNSLVPVMSHLIFYLFLKLFYIMILFFKNYIFLKKVLEVLLFFKKMYFNKFLFIK